MRCPSCGRKFDDKVEPCEFVQNSKLRKAGIAQWCEDCFKDVPAVIIADLRKHPERHIRDAKLRQKHEKFKALDNRNVVFNDVLTVVKTSLPSSVRGGCL